MEYTVCTQSVKPKDFLVQLVQKKVRISIGNIDLFAYYTLILFSEKYRNFIGSRSCPNRTKLAMEYTMCTMCTQSVKRKEFLVQLVYKKDRFSIGNFDLFGYHTLILFSKIQKFYRDKELSKSNQTRYGVYHVYLERKTKRFFGAACLEKSSYFNRKYRLIRLLYAYSIFRKIQKFYRVKELSKSNQTRYEVSHVYLERKTKRNFGIAYLQKSSFFNRKFRLLRLFYFQKYRNFIGTRNCPNRTKLAMEYTMCTQSVKRKEFLVQLLYKKDRFSIGNFDFFG